MKRSRIRARRAKPRRSARVRCPAYLEWVRTLPCCLSHACVGPIEAHHAGSRGLGQKCSDLEAIPLCTQGHRWWHDGTGAFAYTNKVGRADWTAAMIAQTQARARAEGVLPTEDQ